MYRQVMNGSQLPTNQLHDINWGTLEMHGRVYPNNYCRVTETNFFIIITIGVHVSMCACMHACVCDSINRFSILDLTLPGLKLVCWDQIELLDQTYQQQTLAVGDIQLASLVEVAELGWEEHNYM